MVEGRLKIICNSHGKADFSEKIVSYLGFSIFRFDDPMSIYETEKDIDKFQSLKRL